VTALAELITRRSPPRLASDRAGQPSTAPISQDVLRHRVAVVVEVALYREGLTIVLGGDPRFDVVASVPTVESAAPIVRRARPDMILLDAGGPLRSAVRTLTRAAPGARVVALGIPEAESEVVACAEAQVAAIVTTDTSIDRLLATLERVARNETLYSPRVAAMLLRRVGAMGNGHALAEGCEPLTLREREIVELINDGLSNKEIAQHLCIELSTVKNHVHHVLEKLQVRRRGEAAAWLRARSADRTDASDH
jgi:two-component system, NarL family, nitrate/nitrite response regulator NarL